MAAPSMAEVLAEHRRMLAHALDGSHRRLARAEAAEAIVARVQALYDAYMAWDGDPSSEFASSPHQREQLRRALEG